MTNTTAARVSELRKADTGHPDRDPWRSDLDRLALPPTDNLTPAQRRVLQACLGLFADKGFLGSSTRDIAAELGQQSPSLYKHFRSKHAMLAALALVGFESHHARLLSAVIHADSDPRAQLYDVMHAHVMQHCCYPLLGVVVAHEWSHVLPADLAPVLSLRAQSSNIVLEILRRGHSQGIFQILDVEMSFRAITSIAPAITRWFPYQTVHSAAEVCDHHARMALRMAGGDSDIVAGPASPLSD